MEIIKLFPFFLFIFNVAAKSPCPASYCLQSGPAIRFPFQLSNQTRPSSCSYPGFNLISCGTSNETTIHLQSVPFIVQEIDYKAQKIRINDPDCLPGKILSLNDIPSTPFLSAFYEEFTFFSCRSGHRRFEMQPISCLSNSTRSVYATSSSPTVRTDLFRSCDVMKTVYVPVQFPSFGGNVPSSVLFQDIVLHWDSPACQNCEARRVRCGLEDGPGIEIGCFSDVDVDSGRLVLQMVWITLLIVSSVSLCFIGCGWASLAYQTATSCPKSEVKGSGHLSNSDGPKCPICLSTMRTQDTLKILNLCKHSFHSKCIDKWFLQNATCPVCRGVIQHTTVNVT